MTIRKVPPKTEGLNTTRRDGDFFGGHSPTLLVRPMPYIRGFKRRDVPCVI